METDARRQPVVYFLARSQNPIDDVDDGYLYRANPLGSEYLNSKKTPPAKTGRGLYFTLYLLQISNRSSLSKCFNRALLR